MQANNGILRGFKGSLYEGGIRTPLIVSWPARFRGGRVVDIPVISLDILPTSLEAIGVKTPIQTPFDGKSLLPLLTGKSKTHHPELYWNSGGPKGEWAVRQGDWKIHGVEGRFELFDLSKDPSETHDLAAQQPEKARELSQSHQLWLQQMVKTATAGGLSEPRRGRARSFRMSNR